MMRHDARSLEQRILALWQLTRLEHGIMYCVCVLIGVFLAVSSMQSVKCSLLALGVLTTLFIQAGTFALNDYYDSDVDILNQRFDRPIVRGELSRRDAFIVASIALSIGIALAFFLPLLAAIFALSLAFAGIAYDVKLKELGVAANAYIAFTMAAPFIFGGFLVSRLNTTIFLLSAIAFTAGFGREVMKDIADIEGDIARNVKSIARKHGTITAFKVVIASFIAAVFLSVIPFLLKNSAYFMNFLYIGIVSVADAILMHVCLRIRRCMSACGGEMRCVGEIGIEGIREEMEACRRETLFALAVGMFAFLFAAFA